MDKCIRVSWLDSETSAWFYFSAQIKFFTIFMVNDVCKTRSSDRNLMYVGLYNDTVIIGMLQ